MKKLLTAISTYRTALMGIAIIGVMIGHCKTDWPVSVFSKAVGVLCYSVFTGGFLFLSGFGLYYSMSKNASIMDFYVKRMKRVLIPWACIAIPYFLFMDVIHSGSWSNFIWHVSTLAFWKFGNYSGMWYISVILALYIVYPLYHRIAYKEGLLRPFTLLLVLGLILTAEYLLVKCVPDYYERISICKNVGLFFIGSEVAASMNNERKWLFVDFWGAILLNLLADFVLKIGGHIYILYNLLCICLWAWLFSYIQNFKIGNASIRVVEWFGRYTLELYMIHLFIYYIMKNVLLPDVSNNILFPVAVTIALIVCKPANILSKRISKHIKLLK